MLLTLYWYICLALVSSSLCKIDSSSSESDENSDEDISNIKMKSNYDRPEMLKTERTDKTGAVVEKFVETLISSEKYLKQIESVQKKINHVDHTLHERTNVIIKYLTEIMKAVSSGAGVEESLRNLRSNLDRFKQMLTNKAQVPHMRDGVSKVNPDAGLDGRLHEMENQIKTIMSGVESIVEVIQEVKSRQYPKQVISSDNQMSIINELRKTLSELKLKKCDCSRNMRASRVERYPTDCHEIQMQGFNVSGIYKIQPEDIEPFYVLCDLSTSGGAWTVFQNRFDGTLEFYKSWSDYKHGFGNLAGEFWLGLEKLHYLTNQKLYELRITVETHTGQEAFAGYSVFTISPEHEGYRISTLGTFYGSAGDSLSYHAGQKFSTPDVDNDEWEDGACAAEHGGAWWYKQCDKSNLNGKYMVASKETGGQSIYWISFKEPTTPLTKTRMMIRPLPASRPNTVDEARKYYENSNIRLIPDNKRLYSKDQKHGNYNSYSYDKQTRANHANPILV